MIEDHPRIPDQPKERLLCSWCIAPMDRVEFPAYKHTEPGWQCPKCKQGAWDKPTTILPLPPLSCVWCTGRFAMSMTPGWKCPRCNREHPANPRVFDVLPPSPPGTLCSCCRWEASPENPLLAVVTRPEDDFWAARSGRWCVRCVIQYRVPLDWSVIAQHYLGEWQGVLEDNERLHNEADAEVTHHWAW
jgi:hypothetical protein